MKQTEWSGLARYCVFSGIKLPFVTKVTVLCIKEVHVIKTIGGMGGGAKTKLSRDFESVDRRKLGSEVRDYYTNLLS